MNFHTVENPEPDTGILAKPDSPISLPRVNVVITCFNYGQFVAAALDSVAAQTYGNFSCVVVDDASTDNTAEIIEGWMSDRQDSRFRWIRNQTNLGQMGSFVTGLAGTEGEFVAFLDADDIWFPDFLQTHIQVHLNRAQSAGASSSDLIQIDAKGRILAGSTMPPVSVGQSPRARETSLSDSDIWEINNWPMRQPSLEAVYVRPDVGRWHWSVTSGMVFRRPMVDLLTPAGTDKLRLGGDLYLMVLSHYFAGSFVIRNALGAYRRHGTNNFSNLPLSGAPGTSTISKVVANTQNAYRAMLDHLLTADRQMSLAFAPAVTRKCARALFRYFLLQGVAIDDPRLVALLGQRQILTDRLFAKSGLLGRQLRRKLK